MQIYPPKTTSARSPESESAGLNLDTLRQLEKSPISEAQESFQKQAWKKQKSKDVLYHLVDVEGSPLNKQYWQTWHCRNSITKKGRKLQQTKACNKRWCFVCNGKRTAEFINGYKDAFNAMKDPWFITLTRINVSEEEIAQEVEDMKQVFNKCKHSLKKEAGLQFNGIRVIECTYKRNTKKDVKGKYSFNPHFHLIVDGCKATFALLHYWLKKNGDKADIKGQDWRPANKESLLELFKYVTKLQPTKGEPISGEALDAIFKAFAGIGSTGKTVRTVQPFGSFKKAKTKREGTKECDWKEPTEETVTYTFETAGRNTDWYSSDGEAFSESELTEEQLSLLDNIREGSKLFQYIQDPNNIDKESQKKPDKDAIGTYWRRHPIESL